jgi:hypothetical protein
MWLRHWKQHRLHDPIHETKAEPLKLSNKKQKFSHASQKLTIRSITVSREIIPRFTKSVDNSFGDKLNLIKSKHAVPYTTKHDGMIIKYKDFDKGLTDDRV